MDYYKKYLKYKNKYLQLKQSGGLMNVIYTDPSLNRTMTLEEYFNEAISKELFDCIDINRDVNDRDLADFLYGIVNNNFCDISKTREIFNRYFDFNYSDLNIQKYNPKYYYADTSNNTLSVTNKIKINIKNATGKNEVDVDGGFIHIERIKSEEKSIIYKMAICDSSNVMIKYYNFNTLEEAFEKFTTTTYNFECKDCREFTSSGRNIISVCNFDFNNIKNLLIEPSDNVIELTKKCTYIQNKNIIIYDQNIYVGNVVYENGEVKNIIIYPKIQFLVPKQNYSNSLKNLFENTSSLLTSYNTHDISFNKFVETHNSGFRVKEIKDRINNIELLPFNFYHLHLIKVNREPRDFLFIVHGKYEDHTMGTGDEIWTYDGKRIIKKDLYGVHNNIIQRIHNYFIHIKLNDAGEILFKKIYVLNIQNINKLNDFFSGNISFKYILFGDPIYSFNYIDNKENVLLAYENIDIEPNIGVDNTFAYTIGIENRQVSDLEIIANILSSIGIESEQVRAIYQRNPAEFNRNFSHINLQNQDEVINTYYTYYGD